MAARCRNKDCLNCKIEKCILEMSEEEYEEYKRLKKAEYNKEYFKKNAARKKQYAHDWYMNKTYGAEKTVQVKFVRYVDVRQAVKRLKKQIGEVNCKIILDAIDQIEKDFR